MALSPSATGALISPKKSTKAYFKTPEGRYRLVGEITAPSPPKIGQRLTSSRTYEPTTVVSLISYGHMEEELSGAEESDEDGEEGSGDGRSRRPRRNIGLLVNAGHKVFMYDYWRPQLQASHIENFNSVPTAHCYNYYTSTAQRLDLVIGFLNGACAIGDTLSPDPTTQFFNATGAITSAEVTRIKWLPRSSRLFIVSHADGDMYVYDRDRTAEQAIPAPGSHHGGGSGGGHSGGQGGNGSGSGGQNGASYSTSNSDHHHHHNGSDGGSGGGGGGGGGGGTGSWSGDGCDGGGAWVAKNSTMGKDKVKCNPVSRWHISSKKVTDFSFSQDGKYLAVTSHDGWLRIFDYAQERHLMSFKSYYAAFLTVAWSTDGRFLLTGGQDDLVSIWSFDDQCLVARCRGHSSFVTSVAFDPWSTYFDQTYVFGSVGQDCNLLIWEFSVGALHRSRKSTVSAVSAPSPGPPGSGATSGGTAGTRSHPVLGAQRDGQPVIVPAPGRYEVPVLGPVGEMRAHNDLCSQIIFLEGAVVTAAVDGNCKIWARPSKLLLWGRRAAARALGQRPPLSDDDQGDDLTGGGGGRGGDDDDMGRRSRGDTVDTSLTSDMHDISVVSERSAGDIDLALRTPGQTPARSRTGHDPHDPDGGEVDNSVPTPLRGMRERDEEEKAERRRRQAERADDGRIG